MRISTSGVFLVSCTKCVSMGGLLVVHLPYVLVFGTGGVSQAQKYPNWLIKTNMFLLKGVPMPCGFGNKLRTRRPLFTRCPDVKLH